MSKYDVYGLGNALVDLEYKVDAEFFAKNGIEKGLMTLVDEDRQKELLNALGADANIKRGGGSAANTVIATSQFGGETYYSCRVANDTLGSFYLEDLKRNGVHYRDQDLPQGTTGTCLVMVTPDADRTMNTFLGITGEFSEAELNFEEMKQAKYVYVEGYLACAPNAFNAAMKALAFARENGIKTSLTFSDPGVVAGFRQQFIDMIGDGVDLLFCNEAEALSFTQAGTIAEAREELKKYAKAFAITLGASGALVYDGDTFIHVEPFATNAIDTNGAGDMFAGAFLYGITNGHGHADAGKLACLASSKVVSQYGPRLEWAEVKEVLHHLVTGE